MPRTIKCRLCGAAILGKAAKLHNRFVHPACKEKWLAQQAAKDGKG